MSEHNPTKVMYRPFQSLISPGFWQTLMDVKLNNLRLSQEPLKIHASYSCGQAKDLPCIASFDESSFSQVLTSTNYMNCHLVGKVVCFNTKREFIECLSSNFLKDIGQEIWTTIRNGDALVDPEGCLSRFGLLVHADIKKYKFTFMFAFPALSFPDNINYVHKTHSSKKILDVMNEDALSKLQEEYQKSDEHRSFQRGYFILTYLENVSDAAKYTLNIYPLSRYDQASEECKELGSKLYFAYNDPSGSIDNPGWPLRNYLCLVAIKFKLPLVNLIRIRMGPPTQQSKIRLHHSLIITVEISQNQIDKDIDAQIPKIVGWEPDDLGKVCPRKADLSKIMDPKILARDAVDLNLRLMKWRLMPSLDLDRIANTKCLLLGCGTLGCHVARGLLAWGVKNLTLVDNSRVSYSNPVRQSLYVFDDCSGGPDRAFKAEVAAKRLLQIHPTINVKSYILSIPMPGHSIGPKEIDQIRSDVRLLDELIEEHDTIFLMTDTRESRWLPTVIGIAKQKLVINSAIGFDTFLVQRHPIRQDDVKIESNSATSNATKITSDQLGCYFCNDIVAPGNSTLDRTLDQQCTVSRPGVSMFVSALAVELFASVMSSPLGPMSPAFTQLSNDTTAFSDQDVYESELGLVPHSIRGDISRYHIYMPTSPCFNKCSACSVPIVRAYQDQGFEFLYAVCNDSNYLEEVAGLKELHDFDIGMAIALDTDDEIEDDC